MWALFSISFFDCLRVGVSELWAFTLFFFWSDFQQHFKEIARQYSPVQRPFYVHLTSVIVRLFQGHFVFYSIALTRVFCPAFSGYKIHGGDIRSRWVFFRADLLLPRAHVCVIMCLLFLPQSSVSFSWGIYIEGTPSTGWFDVMVLLNWYPVVWSW